MSLPEGKAIYLIAFSLLLSYIRKLTDQPATHIAYCLFMLIIYRFVWFSQKFIYIFVLSLKSMYNLNFEFYGKVLLVFYSIKGKS